MDAFQKFMDAVRNADLRMDNIRQDSFKMECPVHDDHNPSVKVTDGEKGVVIYCHAGCNTADIVAALGLKTEDLFNEESHQPSHGSPQSRRDRKIVARYEYRDGMGNPVFTKRRFEPKDFDLGYEDNGRWVFGLPKGVEPWLYHAPELRAGLEAGRVIYVVEGEKDVHSVEKMGGVATTQPHGAGHGKWRRWHSSLLRNATEVRVIMDLDEDYRDRENNVRNTGREYALEVRDSLMLEGVKVTLWSAASGKDATDHMEAGLGLDDLKRLSLGQVRPTGITGDALMVKEFPPLVWAVDGILPQGVCLFAAPPKAGKSFIAVDVAVAVACGGKALGRLDVTQGDVLYIGLEDSERRLQDRILTLCEGVIPECIDRIEWQTIDSGWEGGEAGLVGMEEWAQSADDPRLIVIDTLRKHEPQLDEAKNSYVAEQEMMLRYKRFADRHNVSILFVHHDNKADDGGDWLNKFSGTKGLTGGADTLWYLDRKRGESVGHLRVDGRDVVADDVAIHKAKGRPFWIADEFSTETGDHIGELEERIVHFIREGGGSKSVPVVKVAFPGAGVDEAIGRLLRNGFLTYDEESRWLTV